MELKELEVQVRAERVAEEKRAVAEEAKSRLAQFEAEKRWKERKEAEERERLLRPMAQQAVCGVTGGRVKRMLPAIFPIECIQIPEQIVTILEHAFGLEDDRTALSKVTTTLLRCLGGGDSQHRKEARNKGAGYLAQRRSGPTVEIPIALDGIPRLEDCVPMICGWAIGYLERQEEQEVLLKTLEA
jgi:hypothetical protein